MFGMPSKVDLDSVPGLYETERVKARDKIVYLHFFVSAFDWYVCEYDGDDTFFGFVVIDVGNPEWGYFTLSELKGLKIGFFQVDYDEYWDKRPAFKVDKIRLAEGWE